jgi:hypothetical protein
VARNPTQRAQPIPRTHATQASRNPGDPTRWTGVASAASDAYQYRGGPAQHSGDGRPRTPQDWGGRSSPQGKGGRSTPAPGEAQPPARATALTVAVSAGTRPARRPAAPCRRGERRRPLVAARGGALPPPLSPQDWGAGEPIDACPASHPTTEKVQCQHCEPCLRAGVPPVCKAALGLGIRGHTWRHRLIVPLAFSTGVRQLSASPWSDAESSYPPHSRAQTARLTSIRAAATVSGTGGAECPREAARPAARSRGRYSVEE